MEGLCVSRVHGLIGRTVVSTYALGRRGAACECGAF